MILCGFLEEETTIPFLSEAAEIEEDDGEWEWEEEEEEEVQDKPDEEATGKANITIDGSLVKIDRSKVDWSDDEFEEEEEEEKPKAAPAPPPPPPAPPAPPPPPPPPGLPPPKKAKSDRVEALKKRPTKRPDWNDLMQEIEKYRCKAGMLKKTVTNDRSKPMLSKSKVKGVVSAKLKPEICQTHLYLFSLSMSRRRTQRRLTS